MTVRITVHGGVVQKIDFPAGFTKWIKIEVWDFDTDGADEERLEHNERGEAFIRSVWTPEK